ncbi:MAG: methyltransferase domain-containing protein [Planctomycetes bacterium]|nr:methyltransferase domain-containing protein [Planctomycetota bacterium]
MSTKLDDFMGKMLGDMGAVASASLVLLGDKLGLYKALAEDGPLDSANLAEKTGTTERYVREWLAAQAASGYVEYDESTNQFFLNDEQKAVFADENNPAYMAGAFYGLTSMFLDEPKITKAFRTGDGVAWGQHNECLFCGTEKFFRPGYMANLTADWIPALDGVEEKLKAGAKVADVGCGHGVSTAVMAKAYPKSTFIGYDFHEPSVIRAREVAKEEGVTNVTFEVAAAKTYPGKDFDLVALFDCLHDMGDPIGATTHVRSSLKPDGTLLIVEPFAHDELAKNLNPVGRMYYSFSTMICTPASIAQEVGLALGAQAGEKRLREVIEAGGFTRFRRATETPFSLILEARP